MFNFQNKAILAILLAVVIGGVVFAWQNRDRFLPTSISPTKTQDGTDQGVLENWRTYRNETYGFELKYPPDWFATEDTQGEGVVILTNFKYPSDNGRELNDRETKLVVFVNANQEELSLEEWIQKRRGSAKELIASKTEIEVSGVKGLKISQVNGSVDFLFPYKDFMFQLVNISNKDKLDQIVPTLRFLQ